MTREVGPRLPFIPRQGLSEEKSCVTGPGERDPDQFGNDHPPLTENRNENLFQAKIGPPIAREILEPFVKTNLTAQSVRDILSESVEKAHRENGIRYSSDSHADVETLQKLTKTKYNKKIHHAMLAELSKRGVLENLPRSSVQLGDLGKMSHYKLDDQFQPIEGFGNATIDEKKLANLAQFNFEEGGPALLRHAKVISKEQWNGIKQLAEKRITPEAQRSIDEGDQLQPAIFRYDQKTPSRLNSKEFEMVKQERKAAEESNQDSTLFKVHSFNLTANGLVDFAGGILHSAFIKGNERQLNDPAMRNKTMRTLIEMARAENEDVVAVKKLTKQFNDFEKTGDAQAFIDFLQTEQDIPYRQHILDTLQGKSLAKISKDLQLNKETTSKSQPLKDVLISLLTGKNSNGKKLSRSSEMALHTFLDRQINVDSDAGCKSGQDRTLHLFAMSLASKALEKEFGLDCTAKFLQNFDALAKTYDTAQNPSALRKMFSSAKTREKSFEAMAKEFGLSKEKAQQMMETYRQNYYKAAIETGLPMTQYSTLLPGLKWHNEKGGLKGYLAENRLPINYMPQQITLDDGSTVPIMKHGAFGRRIFTPEGIALVKGLARYRDT